MAVPTTIKDLSTTAASNSPAGSDSIGNPGTIDDYFRAYGGIQRAESINKTWERWNHTPTYIAATQFSVATDLTAVYTVGRRVKATVTAGTVYGTITVSAFSSITTVTVVLDSGSLDAGISEVQLGPELFAGAAGVIKFLGTPTLANLSTAVSDANIARTDAAQTFTGDQVFSSAIIAGGGVIAAAGRNTFCGNSEAFGIAVRYVSSGGAVYFGATDGTGTPGFQISRAGGTAFISGTEASGAISILGTLAVAGAVTGASINGNTITTGTGVLTLGAGKTLTASNTLTLAGTDSTVMTFPTTSATIARTDAANTFTGTQTIGALVATTVNGNTITTGTGVLTLAAGKTLTASNTLTLTGTDGTSLNINAVATLNQGTYTPTVTNATNFTGPFAFEFNWIRHGTWVEGFGSVSGTSSGAGASSFDITIPVACASTPVASGTGYHNVNGYKVAATIGQSSTTLRVSFTADASGSFGCVVQFKYIVN